MIDEDKLLADIYYALKEKGYNVQEEEGEWPLVIYDAHDNAMMGVIVEGV